MCNEICLNKYKEELEEIYVKTDIISEVNHPPSKQTNKSVKYINKKFTYIYVYIYIYTYISVYNIYRCSLFHRILLPGYCIYSFTDSFR
jgi:hypothetical protein